jgi:hypothetical protein
MDSPVDLAHGGTTLLARRRIGMKRPVSSLRWLSATEIILPWRDGRYDGLYINYSALRNCQQCAAINTTYIFTGR